MSRLSADLQFSVSPAGSGFGNTPFDLVEESADQTYLRKALQQPYMFWAALGAQGNGKYSVELPLARFGVIFLRVYSPATVIPTLVALDPINQTEQLTFLVYLSRLFVTPSGYTGQQIISLGRASSDRVERVQFNGQNQAELRYTYDPGAITILYQTDFLDMDGNPAPAPTLRPGGKFIADRDVYGALTVRYQPSYWRFKVYYDLSGFTQDVEVRGINYTALDQKQQPPLPILARYKDLSDLKEFSRQVEEWDFGQIIRTGIDDFEGSEQVSLTVNKEERITNPTDANDFVDVQRPEEMVFVAEDGRKIKLKRIV